MRMQRVNRINWPQSPFINEFIVKELPEFVNGTSELVMVQEMEGEGRARGRRRKKRIHVNKDKRFCRAVNIYFTENAAI